MVGKFGTPKGRRFDQIAYPRFYPIIVANELIDPAKKSYGRRSVLLAGFCAWTLNSKDKTFWEMAMQLQARRSYGRACDRLLGFAPNQDGADKAPITIEKLKSFKKSTYDVLGSAPNVYEDVSRTRFKELLDQSAATIEYAHRLVEIWHYVIAQDFGKQSSKRIAIKSDSELAGEIGFRDKHGLTTVDPRTITRAWEKFSFSISFSYAALRTRVPKKGTILDIIRDGKVPPTDHLPSWFGAARSINDKILSQLPRGKPTKFEHGSRPRFVGLDKLKVDAVELPPPPFAPADRTVIEGKYL